ncbi:predicted protein [Streptomyces viridosporus ATCC 14672]|uniref:Predicted protein n=1 Tax=Streptomyces viridosporus (strain ATCC 14672 / DSM 40746 / JCM 4963 / KCTC 9882 / NRRL B-12104 / FH 1290) TaxID=566461 RepID=D6A724_STRV1|nr:predicted protein [Streptomyces viridosporus ATCC 14672]
MLSRAPAAHCRLGATRSPDERTFLTPQVPAFLRRYIFTGTPLQVNAEFHPFTRHAVPRKINGARWAGMPEGASSRQLQ